MGCMWRLSNFIYFCWCYCYCHRCCVCVAIGSLIFGKVYVESYWLVWRIVLWSILSAFFQMWVEVSEFLWCNICMQLFFVQEGGLRRKLWFYLCWWVLQNMSVLILDGFRMRSRAMKFTCPLSSCVGLNVMSLCHLVHIGSNKVGMYLLGNKSKIYSTEHM
jgi:hypothetical protein